MTVTGPKQPPLPINAWQNDEHSNLAAAPAEPPPSGGFDAALANRLARLEAYNKHLYRPNTYLHKWWARRCGSTFRLILKHLASDPARRAYYAAGGLEGKIVLDPMMGGGTTLHEAIRMGANVIGADIDPIPVLQARATLSTMPLDALEAAFHEFHQGLRAAVAGSYLTECPRCEAISETQFTLYGARRTCVCGPRLMVDSTLLRQGADGSAIRICPSCRAVGPDTDPCRCTPHASAGLLVEKAQRACATCRQPYREEYETPYYARFQPLVVAGRCPAHGPFFAAARPSDLAAIRRADERRADLGFAAREFAVQPGPKSSDLLRRGIGSYLDLFSSRQLLYLRSAIDLLPRFDPLIRLNLAMLVSTSLEFNSLLCGYKGGDRRRPGAVRHTFSHHAYSFPYTALENNPVFPHRASGTLENLFDDRIRRARRWAARPTERHPDPPTPRPEGAAETSPVQGGTREAGRRGAGIPEQVHPSALKGRRTSLTTSRTVAIPGEVDAGSEVSSAASLREGQRRFLLIQGSSAALDLPSESVDYVVTDPPYFDSVQYGDLAAFFRVWLRQLAPTAARWDYDLSGAAVDPPNQGSGQYERVLGEIFRECHRVLKQRDGVLVFTFHHWSPRGWAALTRALQRAGFLLSELHVVHSENPTSVHIVNLKALVHDAILFLRPAESGQRRRWPRPESIDRSDSAAFCRDCGAALGWMLAEGLNPQAVEREWAALL